MRQCPKCGGGLADSQWTCGICGAPLGDVAPADSPPELPALAAIGESPFRPKPRRAPVGVPRRFSIGTMMILVTAFAVLFAVLKTLRAPPAVFIVVTIFVGGIAACQSLLFKGKKPRLASFVGGMVIFGLFNLVADGVVLFFRGRFYGPASIANLLIGTAILTVVFGGPLGYIVGCFIASIFLVRKEPDDAEG
jgi:hypothetical protein